MFGIHNPFLQALRGGAGRPPGVQAWFDNNFARFQARQAQEPQVPPQPMMPQALPPMTAGMQPFGMSIAPGLNGGMLPHLSGMLPTQVAQPTMGTPALAASTQGWQEPSLAPQPRRAWPAFRQQGGIGMGFR